MNNQALIMYFVGTMFGGFMGLAAGHGLRGWPYYGLAAALGIAASIIGALSA